MKKKFIVVVICCICTLNIAYSQVYSNSGQGLKQSSLFKVEKMKYEKDTFILGGVALHPSQTSAYVMAGIVRKFGVYLKLKTNLNFNGSYEDEGDSYFDASSRYFNGNIYKGRSAAIGGLLWRIAKPIIFYGGLGYGTRWVNWETTSNIKYRVTDISYNGIETEAGLIYKYKNLIFSGGFSATSFAYMETNLGIGITF